jgi:putative hydrolase of the HAD superfamily
MTEKYSKISQAKLILFDLGNVMVDIDVNATIMAFKALGVHDVEKYVTQSHSVGGFFTDFERGFISPETFCNEIRRMSGVEATDEEIRTAWNAMIGLFPIENVRLVEALRKRHEVALLSNTNQIHLEYFDPMAEGYKSMNDLFDKAWYSHELHMSKPNSDIYEAVLSAHGCKADEVVFFDDSEANVRGAEAVGITSFVVTKEKPVASYFDAL